MTEVDDQVSWLARFHRGDRPVMEQCYREHFQAVTRTVGTLLSGADLETVVHEVFYRLLSSAELRRSFRGGSFAAWLTTVAKNHAIDYRRRSGREQPAANDEGAAAQVPSEPPGTFERQLEARLVVDRFRREHLPKKWERVFEARFLEQLDQREAAERLGISRTTLAYQEFRIRALLRRFLLKGEEP